LTGTLPPKDIHDVATPIDVAVIGAGVTGLASAWAIAATGRSVCVLERHSKAGLDTSTHNSGVIHAGLYYPKDSLKARLCVDGRERLYAFCETHGVPHARCGKLVVARDGEDAVRLRALKAAGEANGVSGLELVDRAFIREREPEAEGIEALFVPVSGIVDADAVVRTLLRLGETLDVAFLPAAPLRSASIEAGGIRLVTEREDILAAQVVNAAGLYADEVSQLLQGERFVIHPCRGEYAELAPAKRSMVRGLIYPLPHAHGLGVHFVKTLHGAVWLGPTVRFQARKDDYEDDRLPIEAFLEPARQLMPSLTLDDLRLSGSGIRAKLHGPDTPFADFLIRRDRANPRIIQASGIESPGLTACLAVGHLVNEIAASF